MATTKRISGDYTVQTVNETDSINLDTQQVNISGDLFVTGNVNVPANVVADRIVNGSTDVEIPVINGNVSVDVGGVANVAVFTQFGANIDADLDVVANISAGNISVSGAFSTTGNITGGNLNTAGNVWITRDASVSQPTVRFNDTDITISDGTVLGAVEWFTSDTTGTPRVTSSIRAISSGVAGNANIQILTSDNGGAAATRVTILSTGNVGVANVAPVHALSVGGTGWFGSSMTAVGNVVSGNSLTSGLISATGNITGGNLLTGGAITATGNLTANNVIAVTGVTAGADGVSATGDVTGGNIFSDGVISATGNLTTTDIYGDSISVTGDVFGVDFSVAGSVLSGLTVVGNIDTPQIDAPIAIINRIRSDDSSFVSVEDGLIVENSLDVWQEATANVVNVTSLLQLPVFASNGARDAALTAPSPGQLIFVTDADGAGTPLPQIYANGVAGWQLVNVT